MGIQKKNFEVISSSMHIKMTCTKCLKFSFTKLCKDQAKLEYDEIRDKCIKNYEPLKLMKKSMKQYQMNSIFFLINSINHKEAGKNFLLSCKIR